MKPKTERLFRPRIKQTRFGNWYGYGFNGKLTEAFSNPIAGYGAEKEAQKWLVIMLEAYEQEKRARLVRKLGETYKPFAVIGSREIVSYPWLDGGRVLVNVRTKVGDPTSMVTVEIKRGKMVRMRWAERNS